jgi:DhnA family fructose-bisphosphate aldolase class Ia
MISGKQRKMGRLIGADGRTLLVAVDHSVTTGAQGGLADMGAVLRSVVAGGADGVVTHRGSAMRAMPVQRTTALLIHLSGNTSLSTQAELKVRVCDPEAALAAGADAISVHITLGCGHEEDRRGLADLGRVALTCDRLGLPLLVMTYVRAAPELQGTAVLHAARVAAELGADIVKTAHPGAEHLPELAASIDIPVVIAGGEQAGVTWAEFLDSARSIITAGLAGLCVGRRVFGSADPEMAVTELREVVHGETMPVAHRLTQAPLASSRAVG